MIPRNPSVFRWRWHPLGFHLTLGQSHESTVLDTLVIRANQLLESVPYELPQPMIPNLLPRAFLANTENGFPIIAKESLPTSEPKSALFILKSAVDRIGGSCGSRQAFGNPQMPKLLASSATCPRPEAPEAEGEIS